MIIQRDLERRLQADAEGLDRDFPSADKLELRILARVTVTPREQHRGMTLRQEVVLAGLLVVMVALLVIGIGRLRSLTQPVPAGPTHRATLGATCDTQGSPSVPLKMVSSKAGWAHGALRTTDGGLHWKDASPPSLANQMLAYAECFLDWNHAWTAQAVSSGTSEADHIVTFVTTDGGQTWQQSVPVPLAVRVCAQIHSECAAGLGVQPQLYFINGNHGWLLVGLGPQDEFGVSIYYSVLYSTTDGGLHWMEISSSGSVTDRPATRSSIWQGHCPPIVLGVTFVSPTSGWGQTCRPDVPALLVTHDGGVTWQVQRLPSALVSWSCPCQAPLPVFFNDEQGILLGSGLFATSDGGSTWVERSLPPPITSCCGDAAWRVFQVDFLDANTGWAIAPPPGWTKGSPVRDWLYHSGDGGQTWALVQNDLPLGWPVTGLLIVDANDAFAVQDQNATRGSPASPENELLKTSDGGHTWRVVARTQGA